MSGPKVIESDIVLKIDQTDIIDMMVVKERDRLDKGIAQLKVKLDGFVIDMSQMKEDHRTWMKKELSNNTGYHSIITLAASCFPADSPKYKFRSRFAVTKTHGLLVRGYQDQYILSRNDNYNLDTEISYSLGGISILMKFGKDDLKLSPSYITISKHSEDVEKIMNQYNAVVYERSKVKSNSDKFKAHLVEQILGKAMLASLDAVSKSFLLTNGEKNG